jgi:hypothetical protein
VFVAKDHTKRHYMEATSCGNGLWCLLD